MKRSVRLVTVIILVVSAVGLVWVNTGGHTEPGYMNCGGGGFIPQSSVPSDGGVYNNLCLGQPTTGKVDRYSKHVTVSVDVIGGTLAFMSIVAYFLVRTKNS